MHERKGFYELIALKYVLTRTTWKSIANEHVEFLFKTSLAFGLSNWSKIEISGFKHHITELLKIIKVACLSHFLIYKKMRLFIYF